MHRRVAGASPAGFHTNSLEIERATAATENGHGVEG
jgi:hypothetical protein